MTSEKVKLVLEVSPEEADLINFILKIGKDSPTPLINDTQRIEDADVVAHNPKHEPSCSETDAAPVSFDGQSLTQADFTASISDADALTEMVTTLTVEGGEFDIPSIRYEESHPSTTKNSRDNHVKRSLSPPPRIPSPDWSKEEEEFIDIAEKTVRAAAYQSSEISPTANNKTEEDSDSPLLSLASLPQHRVVDSTTSHKQAQPPQPQSQLIPSGRGSSEYKGSDVYAGIQHYPPQPRPRVFKVKEIRHPDNAGHQPILNNGWTDNTPSADFTRKSFSSFSSTSSSYPSKSSGYSTSHSRYHDSEAASDGWVATPLRPVSDDHEGGGRGGRGGNGGGNKRDFDDRPITSHHSSSSSSSTTGQWSWSDKGGWVPFDSKTNYALEAAYQNGHPHEKYFAGGNYYCVDFKEMKQYRLTGRGSRDMRKFRAVQRVPTSRWEKFKESMPTIF